VEHPCYRCAAQIDEGIAFCPHCGAPQIRVVPPEENMPASPSPMTPGGPAELPPTQPLPWPPGATPYPPLPGAIQWDLAWRGALLAGAGAAILSAVPIVSLGCCLWTLGAGAVSVALYQRRVPDTLITAGMGMRLGALAGVFAFVIHAVVSTASFVAFRSSSEFRRALQEQMDKQLVNSPDPRAQEIMRQMFDWINTPQGMATFMVLILVVLAVMFVVFTAAGGALGASMFGRRREFR
jgi:disulfide bond formation protein DsbB